MSNNSTIEMINRINLANKTGLTRTLIPKSKLNMSILKILLEENIINYYESIDNDMQLMVYLRFTVGIPVFKKIVFYPKFVQTRRTNVTVCNLKKKYIRRGLVILTTSQGIMKSTDAITKNIGGIILCQII